MIDIIRFKESYESIAPQIPFTKYVNVKNVDYSWAEEMFLGHYESFGYRNSVNGARRVWAAVYQTLGAMTLLLSIAYLVVHFPLKGSFRVGMSKDWVTLIGIAAAIFAGCLANERSNLYGKWNYLATFFNTIITQKDFDRTVSHRMGCLAHDCLIMEMWNHKSFRASFQEAIVWSLMIEHHYDKDKVVGEFARLSQDGEYDEISRLISRLISKCGPI